MEGHIGRGPGVGCVLLPCPLPGLHPPSLGVSAASLVDKCALLSQRLADMAFLSAPPLGRGKPHPLIWGLIKTSGKK